MHLFCMFYVDRRTTVCPGDGFRNSEGRGGEGGGAGWSEGMLPQEMFENVISAIARNTHYNYE